MRSGSQSIWLFSHCSMIMLQIVLRFLRSLFFRQIRQQMQFQRLCYSQTWQQKPLLLFRFFQMLLRRPPQMKHTSRICRIFASLFWSSLRFYMKITPTKRLMLTSFRNSRGMRVSASTNLPPSQGWLTLNLSSIKTQKRSWVQPATFTQRLVAQSCWMVRIAETQSKANSRMMTQMSLKVDLNTTKVILLDILNLKKQSNIRMETKPILQKDSVRNKVQKNAKPSVLSVTKMSSVLALNMGLLRMRVIFNLRGKISTKQMRQRKKIKEQVKAVAATLMQSYKSCPCSVIESWKMKRMFSSMPIRKQRLFQSCRFMRIIQRGLKFQMITFTRLLVYRRIMMYLEIFMNLLSRSSLQPRPIRRQNSLRMETLQQLAYFSSRKEIFFILPCTFTYTWLTCLVKKRIARWSICQSLRPSVKSQQVLVSLRQMGENMLARTSQSWQKNIHVLRFLFSLRLLLSCSSLASWILLLPCWLQISMRQQQKLSARSKYSSAQLLTCRLSMQSLMMPSQLRWQLFLERMQDSFISTSHSRVSSLLSSMKGIRMKSPSAANFLMLTRYAPKYSPWTLLLLRMARRLKRMRLQFLLMAIQTLSSMGPRRKVLMSLMVTRRNQNFSQVRRAELRMMRFSTSISSLSSDSLSMVGRENSSLKSKLSVFEQASSIFTIMQQFKVTR